MWYVYILSPYSGSILRELNPCIGSMSRRFVTNYIFQKDEIKWILLCTPENIDQNKIIKTPKWNEKNKNAMIKAIINS